MVSAEAMLGHLDSGDPVPQEIVDLIIDQVHTGRNASIRSLATCARISKSWRYRSQRYIFRRLVFNKDSPDSSRVQILSDLMDSPLEGITCHVQTLAIRLYDSERAIIKFLDNPGWTTVLAKIFRTGDGEPTSNSYSISLDVSRKSNVEDKQGDDFLRQSFERMSWTMLPREFINPILNAINSGKVQRLRLRHLVRIPMSFLNVSTLEAFGNSSMVFNFSPEELSVAAPIQTGRPRNQRMCLPSIFDFNPMMSRPPFLDFSKVKKLHWNFRAPEDWFYLSNPLELCPFSLESLEIVVAARRPSLIGAPMNINIPTFGTADLVKLKQLKNLTVMNSTTQAIDESNTHILSVLEPLLPSDVTTLGSYAHAEGMPILEAFNIHITLGSTERLGGLLGEAPLPGYDLLDQLLVFLPIFRSTKIITVHFFLPVPEEDLDEKALEDNVMSRAPAAFPITIQARASVHGSFRIVVDIGYPETEVL
ncbi:hypothetical protein CPC08DRAFT_823849 [Agrocybe pediades]|nr:hypothetical protein CPC08DRAFT_823849 [Agrocybe pediades]